MWLTSCGISWALKNLTMVVQAPGITELNYCEGVYVRLPLKSIQKPIGAEYYILE